MKTAFHLLIAFILLMMIGCQENITDPDKMTSDELLILAIQNASDKQDITIEQLPALSRTVLDQDYSDYATISAQLASRLGYEVSMGGQGDRMGKQAEVYFNIEGRKLNYKGDGRDKDGWDRDDDGNRKCFNLVLPVNFIMPDGSTITVANEDDYSTLRTWYSNNPDIEEKPELQYPVEISFKGIIKTINNDREMHAVYKHCSDRKGRDKKKCFGLVYPVVYVMPDGSTITVPTNDEDGWTDLKAWYNDHPDSDERPALQYPVDIVYRDETIVTVNNDDEMRRAKAGCDRDGDGDGDRDCFDLVLPVTFIMPDGSTITVEDETGYMTLRTWYQDNPVTDVRPALQYPVDIVYRDGTTVTINNDDEMRAAKADCERDHDGGGRP